MYLFLETKISELQKKVTGLLQIVNELVKLLHKSNIKFPASCPVDDFKSFRKTYLQCKEKSKLSSTKGDIKKSKQFLFIHFKFSKGLFLKKSLFWYSRKSTYRMFGFSQRY